MNLKSRLDRLHSFCREKNWAKETAAAPLPEVSLVISMMVIVSVETSVLWLLIRFLWPVFLLHEQNHFYKRIKALERLFLHSVISRSFMG